MLVNEVKPIGKFGKNLLKKENAEDIIERIVETPLQNACKQCREKNIETVMSSANKNNIVEPRINKKDVLEKMRKSQWGKMQNFEQAGKGYAWIMINYNTLSDKNRKILFDLADELGEDTIWFVKENYTDAMNYLRRKLKLKPKVQTFEDKYAEEFKKRQLKLVYKNVYPSRNVFIRMPIEPLTTTGEVEEYFDTIIKKLVKQ